MKNSPIPSQVLAQSYALPFVEIEITWQAGDRPGGGSPRYCVGIEAGKISQT